MPLDGIFLHFLKNELAPALIGSRVEKVHQPSKDELVLVLRARSGGYKLLLSSSANSPRLHLTGRAPENPASPPMLCMLLRKRLGGATITGLTQAGLDRTVFIDFDAANEIGDRVKLRLCVEIMSKHSNIILIDGGGLIVDAVKRVGVTQSSYRQVEPGLPYVMPPAQDKISLAESAADEAMDAVSACPDKALSAALLSVLEGASPLICREIASRCGGDMLVRELSDFWRSRLRAELDGLSAMIGAGIGSPLMLRDPDGKPRDFSFTDITQYGFSLTPRESESFSRLLDDFYFERDRLDRTKQRGSDMLRAVTNAVARVTKKIALQREELLACADRENLRIKAELINANLGVLRKGTFFYDLENYYNECTTLRVAADPSLSPSANAQKYYKEYRKAKTAEGMLTELIKSGEQELLYLETVSDLLHRASSQAELSELRDELESAGYLKHHRRREQKKPKKLPPLMYRSSDGFAIYVGRNNVQNDQLSLKTAGGRDIWLHTQKIPGSHVIIAAEGRDIPDSTIEQAAVVAAYHSKARDSGQVAVDYTAAKNLKKPPGAKPGFVIYHVYRTLTVKPEREAVERLEIK
ncbi:MAG: NFACT family protein [Oscillospiraceae bacterium]|nr:NFACT family protein [Oscillospiraceae bacterium]